MYFKQLIAIILLILPMQAWSAYDLETIKNGIDDNQPIFKVLQWRPSEDKKSWSANTALKRVSISLTPKESIFIAPYINRFQKKAGKALCFEFANLSLKPANTEESKLIKSAIRKATTRHRTKFLVLNDVKFTVTPKLIGSVVSLHCSIKPI